MRTPWNMVQNHVEVAVYIEEVSEPLFAPGTVRPRQHQAGELQLGVVAVQHGDDAVIDICVLPRAFGCRLRIVEAAAVGAGLPRVHLQGKSTVPSSRCARRPTPGGFAAAS